MKKVLMGAVLLLGTAASAQRIDGAGATFPFPIYSKWFSEYNKLIRTLSSTISPSVRAAASSSSPTGPSTSGPATLR